MSRILRRPMFRGGGKVSSYGNGIASGLASGGRVGYESGGDILQKNIIDRSFDKFNKFIGNTTAINPNTNKPYTAAETQAILKNTRGDMNMILNPFAKLKAGQMLTRAGIKYAGLPSASKVKDFFTKSPQSASKELGTYKGPAPVGTDRFFAEKLRPMFQNTGAFLKDALGGAGKLKDYKTAIGVGGVGGGLGLSKLYEGFKERQIGSEPSGEGDGLTDAEKEAKRLQEELYKLRTAQAYGNPTEEQSSAEYKETVVDKKARLKEKAKEYEDILGAGIKKDSIFDAMVEGGTRLYEGAGAAEALRAANTALDPIQNVKTASRKLALEEDIAIRKALAVAKGKRTATGELLDFYKGVKDQDGKRVFSDVEIAEKISKGGSKGEKLIQYKEGLGVGLGFKQYVKDEYGSQVKFFDVDVEKVDFENVEDGVYYQPPTGKLDKYKDKFITVKDNKVIAVTPRTR